MRPIAFLTFATLLAAACSEASAPRSPLSVMPTSLRLPLGDTARLASSDSRARIVWWSDRPSVATVDALGLVTAVTPGSASVWALRGTDSVSAVVEVYAFKCAGNPEMSPNSATLAVGDTIRAYAKPGCSPLPGEVTWVSSDPAVAVVTSRGTQGSSAVAVVAGIGAGTATVTARSADDPPISVTMAVIVR